MNLIPLTPVQSTRLLRAAIALRDAPKSGVKRIEAERLLADCLLDVNGAPFMFAGPLAREGAKPYPFGGVDPVVTEARARLDKALPVKPAPWTLGGYEEYQGGFGGRVIYIDPEDDTLAIIVDENPDYIRRLLDGDEVLKCFHPAQAIIGPDGLREDGGWTYVTPDEDSVATYDEALAALAVFKAWIAEDAAIGEAEAAANG